MADDKKYVETTDTGHGYENRQDIYYNDNVGGRAVFVDAKEHDQESVTETRTDHRSLR